MEAPSSCTEQIQLDKKSDTERNKKWNKVKQMKQPVQIPDWTQKNPSSCIPT